MDFSLGVSLGSRLASAALAIASSSTFLLQVPARGYSGIEVCRVSRLFHCSFLPTTHQARRIPPLAGNSWPQ